MEETGYNGWKNYETWCVSLWLSNDEGLYNETLAMAQAAVEGIADDDPVERARYGLPDDRVYSLANDLREYVEELPEVTAITGGSASFVVDLLGAALSEVDWQEIAANLLSEVTEVTI